MQNKASGCVGRWCNAQTAPIVCPCYHQTRNRAWDQHLSRDHRGAPAASFTHYCVTALSPFYTEIAVDGHESRALTRSLCEWSQSEDSPPIVAGYTLIGRCPRLPTKGRFCPRRTSRVHCTCKLNLLLYVSVRSPINTSVTSTTDSVLQSFLLWWCCTSREHSFILKCLPIFWYRHSLMLYICHNIIGADTLDKITFPLIYIHGIYF
jgi:hypothetical protein